MNPKRTLASSLLLVLAAVLALTGRARAQGDPEVIERILLEGIENSHVWETLDHLCDDIGPRLTGSTRLMKANTWARDEFERLGLVATLQQWGTIPVGFDRGPSRARMLEPVERELEFTTDSWSQGTDGPVRAEVRALPTTMEELEAVGFDYAGCWILCPPRAPSLGPARGSPEEAAARAARAALDAALDEIGIAGRIVSSASELVLTSSVRGWRELTMETLPKGVSVQVRKSDHEALAAALASGARVVAEIDLQHRFVPGPVPVYNTIAEIRGSEKPDEVVIVSGHLDSWDGPGSKGAQDNGTGSAVTLEAARILMAAGVKPRRTIRFALWTGEEQGLLGSAGYLASLSEDERKKISACFVDDGGTNYQGGVMCLAAQKEWMDEALAPVAEAFPELPIENVVSERMGGMGSDHATFNGAGIPGFFWIEKGSGGREGKSYDFVHHTQHDTQRYAVEEYLVQSATCSAVAAYQVAEMEELLPRPDPVARITAIPADPGFQVVLGPMSGEWELRLMDADAPDFGIQLVLETARDGRLRGTSSAMGQLEVLREGQWDAATGTATLQASTDFGPASYRLRIEAGALEGTLAVMGRDLRVHGERKACLETPISGCWRGKIPAMNAEIRMLFQVHEDGELVGRFQSSQSDSALSGGRWDADTRSVSFEYDYPHGGRLPVSAHLEGSKLIGTIGDNAEFEAEFEADG